MKLNIEGMSCGGCVKSVTRIILKNTKLEDSQVQVSLDDNSAELATTLEKDELEQLQAALDTAGFQMTL